MASSSSLSTAPPIKKLINLIRGWPSPHLLPSELLRASANKTLSDPSIFIPALQYGPDPGYEPLREALAVWLGRAYHGADQDEEPLTEKANEICITGGASQSIACMLQSFTDPAYTRAVWAVAPCYFLACNIFEDAGFRGRLRAVPEDDEGINLAALEKGLRSFNNDDESGNPKPGQQQPYKSPLPDRKLYRHVIYVVPTCANPSGKTMSLRRREGLVRLARKYDALVICDDVYDFLQWPVIPPSSSSLPTPVDLVPPLPRLSDIDMALGPSAFDHQGKHFGHAVSNGSFSKLVSPGMRTGWAHGTPDLAKGLSQTGSTRSGGAPSQLSAALIREMLVSGELDGHLKGKTRPALQRRHARAVAAVKEELGWAGVKALERSEPYDADANGNVNGHGGEKEVFGGYFIWLTLPEGGPQAKEVAERAQREENLVVAPGSIFEVAGDEDAARFGRNIRICFSWEEEDDVVEGIKRLGKVLRRMARPAVSNDE
ncbi:pyridoxal phosphate-dependent transferase [Bombardia bombarda]|uniref:Pyridoxal phosphate-dependent transferase n=1 Tax=Bombardia bombarda TaxID=252184 RepID=A0AA40CFQ3_9PEZI|nr:pyridoxal phosphate-dependent transferase [Bombardia bombarda]